MSDRPRPFFILGAQRSGTTLLRLMLNHHPHLCVPHETDFITDLYPRVGEFGDLSESENARRLLDVIADEHHVRRGGHVIDRDAILSHAIESYADLIDAIMAEYARAQGKKRWGDKTPSYTADIDILWRLFPAAKFIHLVRDGRDVAVSQRKMSWLSRSVPRLAADWRWKTVVCHKVGSVLGEDYYREVRYEDLVRAPAPTLRGICEFLDEPYSDSLLEYHRTAEKNVPAESLEWHRSSVTPPNADKIGMWVTELSEADQVIYEQDAGDALELFGYERRHLAPTMRSRLKNVFYSTILRW